MYRVLLVDDEPLALEGLQLLVDWQAAGFEVAGAYQNANDALFAMIEQQPQLVVTDLYMPGLGGLEMMDAARKQGYRGKFIIVSGHNDFELARRSLRLGVSGYFLKPIDLDETAKTLEEVRRELAQQEEQAEPWGSFPAYQAQLTALLSGQPYRAEALPQQGVWQMATWGAPIPYEQSVRMLRLLTSNEVRFSLHMVAQREWVVLHGQQNIPDELLERLRTLLAEQDRELMLCPPTNDVSQLLRQRRALVIRMEHCNEELISCTEAIVKAISVLDENKAHCLVDELTRFALGRGGGVLARAGALLRAGCVRMLVSQPEALRQFVEGSGNSLDLRAIVEMGMMLLSPRQRRLSDEVCRYAQERFAQSVTLDEIAEKLGYNAAYLGRVFRKETGTSFRGWLSDMRMKHAAELLRTTDKTVAEVAQSVGYQKYDNFLEHFKQTFAITPDIYRRQGEQGSAKTVPPDC